MKIECQDLWYRYDTPGSDWTIRDLSLRIESGEKIAVIGPAGSGKTTLVQLLDALMPPGKGEIFFDGRSLREIEKEEGLAALRRRIGLLFQFPEHQFFQETAYDELAFALRNFFDPPETEISARAESLLGPLGLDSQRLKKISPFVLSAGEKRKLALASALMMSPEVLILDEPTAGLDAFARNEIIRTVSETASKTVILVTHNLEDFIGVVDRVIGLADGCKVFDLKKTDLPKNVSLADEHGILLPRVVRVQAWLAEAGVELPSGIAGMPELLKQIELLLK